ncbi:hypothetical protein RB2654_14195 [Rhodobacterales bacterium HTCC2654]|uniref:Uncharacterized protein n=1 Tax=Maritimibacter alkaliphilus HTCC2654 TaxID=314271 RepID=A3VGN8_9RHOB|nr:hypothetical protein RB2654_14195 [Rhodobacterales bacterium HTCC2654] [Maritimibacter alkaliphilus HTCC2654]
MRPTTSSSTSATVRTEMSVSSFSMESTEKES